MLTGDPELAARIKILALHGLSRDAWRRFSDDGYKHYQVIEVGYKYNMMDIQAAIGIHQVRRVDAYWHKQLSVWERYNRDFADLPLRLPAPINRIRDMGSISTRSWSTIIEWGSHAMTSLPLFIDAISALAFIIFQFHLIRSTRSDSGGHVRLFLLLRLSEKLPFRCHYRRS